jgi:transcription initiation factor IIF auxiliary subunit
MNLQIQQGSEYEGHDYWKWWVWLEGPDEELDRVETVVYHLHPTFRNPVRAVTDRASKFLLETAGWGVFKLRATLHRKDGTREQLSHELELRYPDGTPTTA